ncbi:MAG: hypothetical protein ACFFCY_03185 [Promethearchaeota archaeon]
MNIKRKNIMNLRLYRIFGLVLLIFGCVGWLSIFIIMVLYILESIAFDLSFILGFISMFSFMPIGVALFQYLFSNFIFGRIRKNLEVFRNIQKFCYSCGEEIPPTGKVITCPRCNANLNVSEILLKL